MKKLFLVFFLVIYFFVGNTYSENKPRVAVLDFVSENFDPHTEVNMAKLLTNALAQKLYIIVVDKDFIKRISMEFKYGNEANSLDDNAAIQIGKMVGVNFVITGTINRLGSSFKAEIKLIDVTTGQIKMTVSGKDDLLLNLSNKLVAAFVRDLNIESQTENPNSTKQENIRLAERGAAFKAREAAIEAEKMRRTAINTKKQENDKSPSSYVKDTQDTTPPIITITSPDVKRSVNIIAKKASLNVSGKVSDASGVALVTVNNQEAGLDEKGNFNADILLKVGENQIVVTAVDIYRNEKIERFTINRKAMETAKTNNIIETTISASIENSTGKYFALVIGNNNYQYLSKLKTAVNDAREIAKTLREKYGFETKLLEDAKRENILDNMNEYRTKLSQNDNFLIYYAGHGEFEKEANKAYWLPVDAKRDNPSQWIISDDITSHINRYKARHVLIVSDSCYSGTMNRSVETDLGKAGGREEYIKKMADRTSRTLMASGGNEPVSDSGGKGHSIFADSFLKALAEIELNTFTADEIFYKSIRSLVAGRSEQVPEYKEIRNSGHEGGDFIFIKK
ncbi:MAG: caspase family protein [Desulfobacterales bacterium]|nr:caspase family protein [Desulfobacterales bacterium]